MKREPRTSATRRKEVAEYIYECQQCGKWNVNSRCQDDGDGEPGCGERVNLKRIRRWS